jgi:hypothetical protein
MIRGLAEFAQAADFAETDGTHTDTAVLAVSVWVLSFFRVIGGLAEFAGAADSAETDETHTDTAVLAVSVWVLSFSV